MKIHILYNFKEGPWGGGNQFLKALRKYFTNKGCYAKSPIEADVILFNSHHELMPILKLKMKYPEKIFVQRVDGPIFYTRGNDMETDNIIFDFNQLIADGTIFQSKWSRNKSYERGMKQNNFETVIMNAPEPEIFYPQKNKKLEKGAKIKLIATSWAPNIRKGFDIYKFLDDNLDFNRYEMTFVGRSPVKFERIKYVPPQPSERLAEILRAHDIFVIASRNDPCSNALIEALHCGLPAVARNDGGHPEIIGKAGITFNGEDDVLDAINIVSENLNSYKEAISLPEMNAVGKAYYDFCRCIYDATKNKEYVPKKYGTSKYYRLMAKVYWWRCVILYSGTKDGISRRWRKVWKKERMGGRGYC